MTYQKLQTTFERELLYQIITNLREQKLSSGQAKMTAKAFLPVLKSRNVEEFIEKLSRLAWSYPPIMEAFIVAIRLYEKEAIEQGLMRVREELNGGLSSRVKKGGGKN